jgi:plastocyanin
MKRVLRFGLAVSLAVGFAACGGDDGGDDTASEAVGVTTTTAATTSNGSAASLTLVASDFAFDKTSLTAKADQPLTIDVTNNGAVKHNLTIDGLDVDQDVDVAATETTDTVAPAAGSYDYFCAFHPGAMKGTLTVS